MEVDTCGIYKITQKDTGKIYVGFSVDVYSRRRSHLSNLKSGNHTNSGLQSDVNKFGIDSLEFEILELVSTENRTVLEDRERYWIELIGTENCYNIARYATSKRVNPIAHNRINSLKLSNSNLRSRIENIEKELGELKRFSQHLTSEIENLIELKFDILESENESS